MNRRTLLTGSMSLLGTAALASLLPLGRERALAMPHFTPKVRRVVYLFMSGGPSQLETFDHKPGLAALDRTDEVVAGEGGADPKLVEQRRGKTLVRVGLVEHAVELLEVAAQERAFGGCQQQRFHERA